MRCETQKPHIRILVRRREPRGPLRSFCPILQAFVADLQPAAFSPLPYPGQAPGSVATPLQGFYMLRRIGTPSAEGASRKGLRPYFLIVEPPKQERGHVQAARRNVFILSALPFYPVRSGFEQAQGLLNDGGHVVVFVLGQAPAEDDVLLLLCQGAVACVEGVAGLVVYGIVGLHSGFPLF